MDSLQTICCSDRTTGDVFSLDSSVRNVDGWQLSLLKVNGVCGIHLKDKWGIEPNQPIVFVGSAPYDRRTSNPLKQIENEIIKVQSSERGKFGFQVYQNEKSCFVVFNEYGIKGGGWEWDLVVGVSTLVLGGACIIGGAPLLLGAATLGFGTSVTQYALSTPQEEYNSEHAYAEGLIGGLGSVVGGVVTSLIPTGSFATNVGRSLSGSAASSFVQIGCREGRLPTEEEFILGGVSSSLSSVIHQGISTALTTETDTLANKAAIGAFSGTVSGIASNTTSNILQGRSPEENCAFSAITGAYSGAIYEVRSEIDRQAKNEKKWRKLAEKQVAQLEDEQRKLDTVSKALRGRIEDLKRRGYKLSDSHLNKNMDEMMRTLAEGKELRFHKNGKTRYVKFRPSIDPQQHIELKKPVPGETLSEASRLMASIYEAYPEEYMPKHTPDITKVKSEKVGPWKIMLVKNTRTQEWSVVFHGIRRLFDLPSPKNNFSIFHQTAKDAIKHHVCDPSVLHQIGSVLDRWQGTIMKGEQISNFYGHSHGGYLADHVKKSWNVRRVTVNAHKAERGPQNINLKAEGDFLSKNPLSVGDRYDVVVPGGHSITDFAHQIERRDLGWEDVIGKSKGIPSVPSTEKGTMPDKIAREGCPSILSPNTSKKTSTPLEENLSRENRTFSETSSRYSDWLNYRTREEIKRDDQIRKIAKACNSGKQKKSYQADEEEEKHDREVTEKSKRLSSLPSSRKRTGANTGISGDFFARDTRVASKKTSTPLEENLPHENRIFSQISDRHSAWPNAGTREEIKRDNQIRKEKIEKLFKLEKRKKSDQGVEEQQKLDTVKKTLRPRIENLEKRGYKLLAWPVDQNIDQMMHKLADGEGLLFYKNRKIKYVKYQPSAAPQQGHTYQKTDSVRAAYRSSAYGQHPLNQLVPRKLI